jgi:hypothetical protein
MMRTIQDARGRLDQLRVIGIRRTMRDQSTERCSFRILVHTQAHSQDTECGHLKNDGKYIAGERNLSGVSCCLVADSLPDYLCWWYGHSNVVQHSPTTSALVSVKKA